MRRKDSEPIEPTPESNPYGYLVNLLSGKRARMIEAPDFKVGLMLVNPEDNSPLVGIHIFMGTGEKEFFAIDSNAELITAVIPQSQSVTGIGYDEFLGLENHAIDPECDLRDEQTKESLIDRVKQVSAMLTDEEKRSTVQYEKALSVKLAQFVERCTRESTS